MQLRDEIQQQVSDLRSRFEEARRDLPLESSFAETFNAQLRGVETTVQEGDCTALRSVINPLPEHWVNDLSKQIRAAEVNADVQFLINQLNGRGLNKEEYRYRGSVYDPRTPLLSQYVKENRAIQLSDDYQDRIRKEVARLKHILREERVLSLLLEDTKENRFSVMLRAKWSFQEIWRFLDVDVHDLGNSVRSNFVIQVKPECGRYRRCIDSVGMYSTCFFESSVREADELPWKDGIVRKHRWKDGGRPNLWDHLRYHPVDVLTGEFWLVYKERPAFVRHVFDCVHVSVALQMHSILEKV